jgi:hypothetical protein
MDSRGSLDTPTRVANNARQIRYAGLNDTVSERLLQRQTFRAGPTTPPPEGRLAWSHGRQKLPDRFGPQSVLHTTGAPRIDEGGQSKEVNRWSCTTALASQKQTSGTICMDLTGRETFRMMWRSSARRRRGLTRDVSRTSVPEAGQPSQRADWARL